jgi:predicted dehydrogenase
MNDRIGIGIVGLNFGAHVIEHELLAGEAGTYFELKAVCDARASLAASMAERHRVRAYDTLSAMLSDDNVQAVGLFTGPAGRAELLRQVVRSGRDVMTTKPFERDPTAASVILREAKALGRTIYLNAPGPAYEPDIRYIKRLEADHDFGRPVALRWETWCSYRERADGSWYDDPATCPAAPLFRLGIYGINHILQLMEGRSEPASVAVCTSRLFTGRPTPDQAMMHLCFADGALASAFASFCIGDGMAYPDTLTIGYERATVTRRTLRQDPDKPELLEVVWRTPTDAGDPAFFPKPLGAPYPWSAFYEAIQGRPIFPEIPTETIVAGVQVIDALARAEQSGRIESIRSTSP